MVRFASGGYSTPLQPYYIYIPLLQRASMSGDIVPIICSHQSLNVACIYDQSIYIYMCGNVVSLRFISYVPIRLRTRKNEKQKRKRKRKTKTKTIQKQTHERKQKRKQKQNKNRQHFAFYPAYRLAIAAASSPPPYSRGCGSL